MVGLEVCGRGVEVCGTGGGVWEGWRNVVEGVEECGGRGGGMLWEGGKLCGESFFGKE